MDNCIVQTKFSIGSCPAWGVGYICWVKAINLHQEFIENTRDFMSEREASQTFFILLEDLWNYSKSEYTEGLVSLSEQQHSRLLEAVDQLKHGTPVQHITGKAFFFESLFAITKDTLVPRPETEELVAWILENHGLEAIRGLDIGTGSGCIPISLAARRPKWKLTGMDLSAKALEVARKNADNLNQKVHWQRADILTAKPELESFDFIVSNPPYIPTSEVDVLDKNVLDYDPRMALEVPDNDPLRFYREIEIYARVALVPGGALYFEIHENYGPETLALLQNSHWKHSELRKDLSGKNRMIYAQKSVP